MGLFNMSPQLTDLRISPQFHNVLDHSLTVLQSQKVLANRIHCFHLSFHRCLRLHKMLRMLQMHPPLRWIFPLAIQLLRDRRFQQTMHCHPHQFHCLHPGVLYPQFMELSAFFWMFVVGSNAVLNLGGVDAPL